MLRYMNSFWLAILCLLLNSLLSACQGEVLTTQIADIPESNMAFFTSWQIQYSGDLDLDLDVEVFNLDLFDTPIESIQMLKTEGVYVICYLSAGTYEDWRPDANLYPIFVLGKELNDWPGERWLDIRELDILSPILEKRLDLAVQKGCDGVDPDNLDGFENDTGFPLSSNDQLEFNKYLAHTAHRKGLAVGLKNDINQIAELVSYFDWIVNEECFTYQECDLLQPFLDAGKPVFVLEYELAPEQYCHRANQMGFSALHKNWNLDYYYHACYKDR